MKRLLLRLILVLSPAFLYAQAPSGSVAHYVFDNNLVDNSGNNYNGTLSGTAATTDRFGNLNKATSFAQGVSTGQLPGALQVEIQGSFSLSFWFRTSMTASTSAPWYGGNAMIDAEVCGGTSDWGISLIDGGKVAFGIGGSDITIKSTLNYNNGAWHFVTATRDQTAATISLWVDGVLVANTGGTFAGNLVAPTFIGVGRNVCDPTAKYTGDMDEIIVYDRALTTLETEALYLFSTTFTLPLHWVSFAGTESGNQINLNWEISNVENNERFEVEVSADALHFAKEATVAYVEGKEKYAFSLPNNFGKGNYYFRIKQVDLDGRFSYSKTILLKIDGKRSSLFLQQNPVGNELVLRNPMQEMVQQLIVSDAAGKQILVKQINSNTIIVRSDITALKAGYYFLSVITESGSIVLRFVKP